MPSNVDAIVYSKDFFKYFTNQLQVEPDGAVWYVSQFSQYEMEVRELGVFHTIFSREDPEIKSVFDMIERYSLFDFDESLPTTQRLPSKSIMINRDELTKVFYASADESFHGSFLELEQSLMQLQTRLVEYPFAVLNVKLSLLKKDFKPGEECEIRFEFSNRGQAKVAFVNPKYTGESAKGHLSIELWNCNSDERGNSTEEFALSVNCTEYELLTAPRIALPSDKMILEIGSGERIYASFRFPFPKLENGKYIAFSIYKSLIADQTKIKNLLMGELHTDLQELLVRSK